MHRYTEIDLSISWISLCVSLRSCAGPSLCRSSSLVSKCLAHRQSVQQLPIWPEAASSCSFCSICGAANSKLGLEPPSASHLAWSRAKVLDRTEQINLGRLSKVPEIQVETIVGLKPLNQLRAQNRHLLSIFITIKAIILRQTRTTLMSLTRIIISCQILVANFTQ